MLTRHRLSVNLSRIVGNWCLQLNLLNIVKKPIYQWLKKYFDNPFKDNHSHGLSSQNCHWLSLNNLQRPSNLNKRNNFPKIVKLGSWSISISKLKERTRADVIIQMHHHPPTTFKHQYKGPRSISNINLQRQNLKRTIVIWQPPHTKPYQTRR